jgi:hypothetical protein
MGEYKWAMASISGRARVATRRKVLAKYKKLALLTFVSRASFLWALVVVGVA